MLVRDAGVDDILRAGRVCSNRYVPDGLAVIRHAPCQQFAERIRSDIERRALYDLKVNAALPGKGAGHGVDLRQIIPHVSSAAPAHVDVGELDVLFAHLDEAISIANDGMPIGAISVSDGELNREPSVKAGVDDLVARPSRVKPTTSLKRCIPVVIPELNATSIRILVAEDPADVNRHGAGAVRLVVRTESNAYISSKPPNCLAFVITCGRRRDERHVVPVIMAVVRVTD